jgi:hypothetical protein
VSNTNASNFKAKDIPPNTFLSLFEEMQKKESIRKSQMNQKSIIY